MSPEQVRGERVDHRSDVFSFGAVLYELLSGKRAFHANSPVESLNAILKSEPEDLTASDSQINPQLEKIVRRCLEKKPERRFQSASDLSFALEALTSPSDGFSKTQPLIPSQRQSNLRVILPWLVAGTMLLAGLLLGWLFFRTQPGNEIRTAKLLVLPPANTFLMAGQPPVISPDGQTLVFVAMDSSGKSLLYARPLNSVVARPLEGSDGAVLPFWAPDSTNLGFFAQGKLKRINVSGGQPTTLATAPNPRGGAWNREGSIIYCPVPPSPLMRISAGGGEPMSIGPPRNIQGELGRWLPSFLPDSHHYLYVSRIQTGFRELKIGTIDSPESKPLLNTQSSAVYVSPGYLIYRRENNLVAHRFDAEKLELKGEPIPIAQDVGFDATSYLGYFSASDNGVVVYHSGVAGHTEFTWFDRSGKQLAVIGGAADQGDLSLSPDDNRLAFRRVDPQSGSINVWLMDLGSANASRVTFGQTHDFAPLWSPKGDRILFSTLRDGVPNLYQKLATGAGNEEPLLKSEVAKIPFDWSRDGKFIIYGVIDAKQSWDLWYVHVDDTSKSLPFLQTDADEMQAKFSPDGKWVAYVSNESGRSEVYIRPFPPAAGKWQVSTDGGIQPHWRADGDELFYLSSDHRLMSVEVNTSDSNFEHRSPTALFSTRVGGIDTPGDFYDVTHDGKRFILNTLVAEGAYTPITVMLNWTGEVKR
jgi:Tol biopolymer transport system component